MFFSTNIDGLALARFASGRVEAYRQVSRASTGRVTGLLGEVFGATSAIQVAGAEPHILGHLRQLNDERRRAMVRDRTLTQVIDSVNVNTVNLGIGLILLVAASSTIVSTAVLAPGCALFCSS